MPIYEYKCNACSECFEKLVLSAKEKPQFDCPHCGSSDTQKLMSCASFMGGTGSALCSSGSTGGFS
jgi:putative FmdB family regulatory protein